MAGRFKCRWACPRPVGFQQVALLPLLLHWRLTALFGGHLPREGTLQRFGADILDRLAAAEQGIPRKEPWGEWIMTEQVGAAPAASLLHCAQGGRRCLRCLLPLAALTSVFLPLVSSPRDPAAARPPSWSVVHQPGAWLCCRLKHLLHPLSARLRPAGLFESRQPGHRGHGPQRAPLRAHAVPARHRRQDHPLAGADQGQGRAAALDTQHLAANPCRNPKLKPLELSLQQTPPSPVGGAQESEACAALVSNSQLVLVEGGDHNFTSPEAGREMARRVVDFVLS